MMFPTIPIGPPAEDQLREAIARDDRDTIRRLLIEHLDAAVDDLLSSKEPPPLTFEEEDALLAELAELERNCPNARRTPLPPESLTREGIYEDHP